MVTTENKVWEGLTDIVKAGLSAMGVDGYKPVQHSQPSNVGEECAILMSRLSVHRFGWQSAKYDADHPTETMMNERLSWMDEWRMQFSAYRPRTLADNEKTITSHDAISLLATFLNTSRATELFAERGWQVLRVADIRNEATSSDSTQYDFNPSFDTSVFIPQSVRFDLPVIEVVRMRHYSQNDPNGLEGDVIRAVDAHHYDEDGIIRAKDFINP